MSGIFLGVGMTLMFLLAGAGYCYYHGWLQRAADFVSNSSLSVSRRKVNQRIRELRRLAAGVQSVAERFSWDADGNNPVAADIDNLGAERHDRIREILDMVDGMEQEIALLKMHCQNIGMQSGTYRYREVKVPADGTASAPAQTPFQDIDDIEDNEYYWVVKRGEMGFARNDSGRAKKYTGRDIRRLFVEQNLKLGKDFFVISVRSVERNQTTF